MRGRKMEVNKRTRRLRHEATNAELKLWLERIPVQSNRRRALDSLFDRIFYGEPVPTSPENALALRDRRLDGFKFTRQIPIGPYIADFVCRDQMLIVEVDGGQHAENTRDQIRDKFLREEGYRILRFWNNEVLKNHDGVLATILQTLRINSL